MKRILTALLVAIFFAAIAAADDVTDQIDEGLSAYKKGDNRTAVTALEAAVTLIRQARAEQLSKLLPSPLAGWTASDATSSQAGIAFLGGGQVAERTYTKAPPPAAEGKTIDENGGSGDSWSQPEVKITFTQDSPLLQALTMAMGNSVLLGPGQKMLVISGRKAIVDNEGKTIQTMVGEKILVSAEANEAASGDDVKNYFKAVDFAALEEAAKR